MNVTIDISPISHSSSSAHKVRGVGYYIQHLQNELSAYSTSDQFTFISDITQILSSTDILHIPYFDPFFLHLPKFKKYPTIVTIHDLTPIIFPKHFPVGIRGNIKWQMQKYLVKKVDAIITDSEASKKDVVRILEYPEKKVFPVHLAADEAFKQKEISEKKKAEIKKKYDLPEKFVLYVGDATWNKNLTSLLHAILKTDIPLVMVGKALADKNYDHTNPWTKDLQIVQHLAEQHSQIVLTGYIPTEDLVSLYNLATCLIMPSLYEGFGLPVLEAMQSGCPVITTKNGSLPEVASDACLYVDANSQEDIAQTIEKLYTNEELQKELATKGLQQAKKFFWKQTAEQTVRVYKEVYELKR